MQQDVKYRKKNHSQTPATYFGLVVLQPVCFIHHQTGPLYGAQHCLVNGDQLVGREQDVELDLGFLLEEQRERKAGIRTANRTASTFAAAA